MQHIDIEIALRVSFSKSGKHVDERGVNMDDPASHD